jgi:hypothetical protein
MGESIHVLGEGGSVFTMDLPLPESIVQRLDTGQLRRVNADGSTFQEKEPEAEARTARPSQSEPKAAWIGYAVTVLGLSHDDAAALTKQDLIDRANAADTENSGDGEGDEDTENDGE